MYLPTATCPYPTYFLPMCVLTTIAYHVLLTTAYCLLPTAYCLLPLTTTTYYTRQATSDNATLADLEGSEGAISGCEMTIETSFSLTSTTCAPRMHRAASLALAAVAS